MREGAGAVTINLITLSINLFHAPHVTGERKQQSFKKGRSCGLTSTSGLVIQFVKIRRQKCMLSLKICKNVHAYT